MPAASSSFKFPEARLCAGRFACLALLGLIALAGLPETALGAPGDGSANFSFEPRNPTPGRTVFFHSTSQAEEPNQILGLRWDLDDDGVIDATGETASRSFPAPGSYRVTIYMDDLHPGHSHDTTKTVTVAPEGQPPSNVPPSASFASFPPALVAGETVSFFSTSTDPDSPIKALEWDLNGDGRYDDANGPTVSRTYLAAGSYRVALRVTDTEGSSSVARKTIPVSPLVGSLSAPPGLGRLGFMTPFPVVRLSGKIERKGTRLRRLSISAPAGTTVRLRCRGRGCPFKLRSTSARTAGTLRVQRLEGKLLRPRARIVVRITRSDAIGKYTRFRFRQAKFPVRSDRCLVPGVSRPVFCPR